MQMLMGFLLQFTETVYCTTIIPKDISDRGVPIIDSANISATNRAIFTISVIGTTIT